MKDKFRNAAAAVCFGLTIFLSASSYGNLFPFEPPRNFTINPKYIALHHPANTATINAQLYFDQGFTFLYAFNHDAAYWSFLKASESDPGMAMAYWGMALALGTNINMPVTLDRSKVAVAAIQKGIQLTGKGPESEQDYLNALAKRYSTDPNADQTQLAKNYSDAMRALSAKYPDDLDAAVLFAESLLDINPWNQWSFDGKPLEGTIEAVKKLESVLLRSPDHLGANHYYIHAIEASKHPESALMSALRLKTLLPSSGHIMHMPSHIYLLVGDYEKAARQNEAAIAADREYIREYGEIGIYPAHYLSHNYYFLSRALIMQGRFQGAKAAADELVKFYTPFFKSMPELEYYALAPLTVLITFHKWQEILDLPKPADELKMYEAVWRFGRGMAYARLGKVDQALEEQQKFLEVKEKLPDQQIFGYNKADNIVAIAENCLQAQIAEAQGNHATAVELLKKAVKEQDTLRYNEPPDWFFPVRETLGALLLRMEKPAEAEAVFREELTRHPRSGRALFGLKESLKAQSKSHDLYWVEQEYQKAWMYSDIPLTVNLL